ncbi:MAG: ribosome biogenesis GTPase Der [Deltaproteobacteria bacterium]|nr:ribosome biogenesis GTPase Der [Deltaproteobacteria bacterium]
MSPAVPPSLPLVAIVGRANVGKSTLFNRLTQSSQALVDDEPGVTRDRLFGTVTWDHHSFVLVDTGGLTSGDDELGSLVRRQAEAAVAEADAILLVMDGQEGPQPADEEVVAYLRTTGKPVLLVVNKIDHPGLEANLADFYRFGLAPLYPVSAAHKIGLATLLHDLVSRLPPVSEAPEEEAAIRVAVVGRPNVGKSSLINRILGEERVIVSERPGTTRDAIDTPFSYQGRDYVLIDTAGIKRRSRMLPGLERYMVLKAVRAIQRCQVAVLLLDAREGVTHQDLRIARLILDEGRGCLVGVNKWDLVEPGEGRRVLDQVRSGLEFLAFAPILPLSAKTGYHVARLFPLINEIYEQSGRRAGTRELNLLLEDITRQVRPPLFRYRPVKFFYLTQPETHPPTFVAFVNRPEGVPDSYRRYLVRQLRQGLGIPYAPIRLFLKRRQRRGQGRARSPRRKRNP